ncbi:mechanosensitive ion channel protein 10-like [Silene latifolia]|uniref:mechanosensitive ion channel protein 10-like n=1 Tax=Silene latifolia TaxID=37657 RepID=UPI003D7870D9
MADVTGSYVDNATNDVVLSIAATRMIAQSSNQGINSPSHVSTSQEGYGIEEQGKVSTPQRPPKIPNELIQRRSSLSTPSFSKSKSRLVEPPYPPNVSFRETLRNSPKVSPRVSVSTPKAIPLIPPLTPLVGGEDEEDDDDLYKSINLHSKKSSLQKLKVLASMEWIILLTLTGLLVCSLTVRRLEEVSLWSISLWKWCILVLVVISGRLVSKWVISILVCIVERNFLLKKKVLYFIFGLKRSVQVFLWLVFILLAWILLFNSSRGIERSHKANQILHYITLSIAGILVGAGIWLVKTLLIKTVALSFHVKRFFDRIQESILHQYVLQTLSGPPLVEMEESLEKSKNELSFERIAKGKGMKEDVINVEKLQKINQAQVSAWTMKGLVNVIRRTKLMTISNNLDDAEDDENSEENREITNEWEAKAAADKIFKNVAKPGHKYIDDEDLLRFLRLDKLHEILPSFEGATETGKIKKSALRKWVVNAYLERKSLAHSLNDTKTAVKQLNNIASGVILIIDVIVWNLMMGFLTTKILVFITSQLLLVAFMFGNTVKTVFEAIIFVFIMHPFDVGDRCVIDGVQMIVEEMNILTTVFLRYDNEKIFYPNSVLSTKPISNFYRSPEMSDAVEFSVDFSTTAETISVLKARIKEYIESKPQHWRPGHSVQVKDIVNMNKMPMAVYVNHTINFQNAGDRGIRRSDLVMELKKILEDLEIKYYLVPQPVHVSYVGSPASTSVS